MAAVSMPVRAIKASSPTGSNPIAWSSALSGGAAGALTVGLRPQDAGCDAAPGTGRCSSSSTSCADSTSLAPCRIRAWHPRDWGAWMEPGMANTSRPCSTASRAVINEPDANAASTTSVPCDSPAMMRLRLGKLAARGGVPRGYSLIRMPWAAMRRASPRF